MKRDEGYAMLLALFKSDKEFFLVHISNIFDKVVRLSNLTQIREGSLTLT